jgi:hypothetical protein
MEPARDYRAVSLLSTSVAPGDPIFIPVSLNMLITRLISSHPELVGLGASVGLFAGFAVRDRTRAAPAGWASLGRSETCPTRDHTAIFGGVIILCIGMTTRRSFLQTTAARGLHPPSALTLPATAW